MHTLKGKQILLGVPGGIAIYRVCDLIRLLRAHGATVRVMQTKAATQMISPQVFQALAGNPVLTDDTADWDFTHLDAARGADLLLVAPATANTLAKFATGVADNLLSTTFLAFKPEQVMIAPAMNPRMIHHPNTQRNLDRLIELGVLVIDAEHGAMACGDVGEGRLVALQTLVDYVTAFFTPKTLLGKKVLVTAGPTEEAIDPVRFLSNHSSGRMGIEIALEAWRRGADVTLVAGTVSAAIPSSLRTLSVTTAAEMSKAVNAAFEQSDITVAAAAVSDFRPQAPAPQKVKKGSKTEWVLPLVQNEDILLSISKKRRENQHLIGFALESESLFAAAEKKLKAKQLDLIVGNTVQMMGARSGRVTLLDRNGVVEDLQALTKPAIAERLWDKIIELCL